MQAYKFLRKEGKLIVSDRNNHKWKIGKWYSVEGEVIICRNGFHASKRPLDALKYVNGNVIGLVEYRGDIIDRQDKLASREMRIVQAYHWTEDDNIAMQAYCASLVLHIFEKAHPDDPRVRECINVMRQYARGNATLAEMDAARSAARTAAQFAAGPAARAAVVAARDIASTSVWDVVWDAAWAVARDATEKKINAWIVRRIKKKMGRVGR